jgi:hypothetical protein
MVIKFSEDENENKIQEFINGLNTEGVKRLVHRRLIRGDISHEEFADKL